MRVAALLPAATDIVIALGAGDQLVAVTHACSLPGRLAGIPRVTRSRIEGAAAGAIDAQVSDLSAAGTPLFDLDEATLAAQRPDVILTQAVCEVCAVREEDARAVASRMTPPPHVATLGARTVDGILDDCMTVARALEIPEEGEELVAGLRSRMAAVHRTLKQAMAPRPGVLVLEWTNPPFTQAGMAGVHLDPSGRLQTMRVVPADLPESPGPWPEPDWTPLFGAAAYTMADWSAAEPLWTPPVSSDVRRAWT